MLRFSLNTYETDMLQPLNILKNESFRQGKNYSVY